MFRIFPDFFFLCVILYDIHTACINVRYSITYCEHKANFMATAYLAYLLQHYALNGLPGQSDL